MSGGFWVTLAWMIGLLAWLYLPRALRAIPWVLYGIALRTRILR